MLNLECIFQQDRLLRAMTELNRKAFETLVPSFAQAYEQSRVNREVERKRAFGGGRKATLRTPTHTESDYRVTLEDGRMGRTITLKNHLSSEELKGIYEKGVNVLAEELGNYLPFWHRSKTLPKWDITILPN